MIPARTTTSKSTTSLRERLRNGTRFAVSRAKKAIRFISSLYAGIGLTLPKFQRRLVARLFGNVKSSGYRLYRWLYYSTARKNAKSTLVAAISLFLLFADGEPNPRIYYCATTLEQTAETFEIADRMIKAKPKLDRNTKVIDSQNRKQIIRFANGKKVGYILALTSRGSKEGKPPSAVIFDELCDWTEVHRPLWRSMTMGSFARKQPLFLITSTAGEAHSTICREQYEYAKKVESGEIDDPQYLPFIIEADPEKWNDVDELIRVNPLVQEGYIPVESIEAELQQAQQSPADEAKVKNKRANIWIDAIYGYLNLAKWRAAKTRVEDADLVGKRCYAGLDLGATDDMCALALLFPWENNTYVVRPFFWIPQAGMARRKKDGNPYDRWIQEGQVYVADKTEGAPEGETVDYHLILAKIKELKALYKIQEIGVDQWSATYIVQDLERLGIVVSPFGQGFKSMSQPLKDLKELVLNGRLIHNGHEVLTWQAGNLVAKEDDAGNVKPTKNKRARKIDGMVALVMALGTHIRNRGPKLVSALQGIPT